jgi:hypothetical protein
MTFSIELLRNDPDFLGLFKQKANEIRATKANLLSAASEYQKKYAEEINEGTEKRKLLLEEGAKKGLKEEEVFKDYQVFIPNAATPILNYLFFMLREKDYSPADSKVICERWEKEHGSVIEEADVSSKAIPNSTSFIYVNIGDETFSTIKKLKTLSYSRNTAEGDIAYKKCIDLCRRYNLEFDKIPVNN